MIVTPGGTNVYPEDLEAALRRQPEVKDCVVVGMERGGNAEPCAVVILRGEAKPRALKWCSARINRWPNISECGCGLSGRRKIFRGPTRRSRGEIVIREVAQAQLLDKHARSPAARTVRWRN